MGNPGAKELGQDGNVYACTMGQEGGVLAALFAQTIGRKKVVRRHVFK